jgi:cilia- and flagella-associated protein 57
VGEERLVVGTDTGDLLLFDMGECRAVLPQSPGASGGSVDVLVAYGRGFVCGGSSGIVHVFEKTDDKDYYKRVRSIKVDSGAVQAGSSGGGGMSTLMLL